MKNNDKMSVLYKINMRLVVNGSIIEIPKSDIVSVSITSNYDTMTYPIIRIRLYSDIEILERIVEYYNDINIRCNFDGGVYLMSDEDKTPRIISPTKSISMTMKCYIKNKNTPTSTFDQYVYGIKKEGFNENVKVPIELFCYNETLIHSMKQKSQSIYKDMSLLSILNDIFTRNNILDYDIDELTNNVKYPQVLIPNLNILNAVTFLDVNYGFYKKGTQLFGDIDKLYISNVDVNNGTVPLPIYVDSFKNNDDTGGVKQIGSKYSMQVKADNVSVISQTDIERIMNSDEFVAIDLNTLYVDANRLNKLFDTPTPSSLQKISTPDLLHKTKNTSIVDYQIARINERITYVDVSGVGFDIQQMNINSRYNLIFETSIRGMSMNESYRAQYVCHVLTNLSSDLFVAQTTMQLCSN